MSTTATQPRAHAKEANPACELIAAADVMAIFAGAIADGVREEREACAKLAESYGPKPEIPGFGLALSKVPVKQPSIVWTIADAIRARPKP